MRVEVISQTPHRPKYQIVVITKTGQKNKKGRELFSSKTMHVTGAELSVIKSNNRDRIKNDT